MNFQGEFGGSVSRKPFYQGGETAEQVTQNILWHMAPLRQQTKRTDDVTMIVARIK